MIYLMFATALTLSAVAAYYSIAGLVAIFAAAVVPIIIMGGTLEVAKLVIASWIYRNWKEVPLLMKSYFMVALVVLMCLTSMGIFGYLSKAHLDQAVPTGDIAAKVALIEDKIKIEKDTINDAKRTLDQLDSQVNQTISRTAGDADTKGIDRSVTIRKQQSKERKQLFETISTSQSNIAKLNEEKTPIQSQLRKVEAEVGPIKYIAALIYGDNLDESFLEKAVRVVILMIVSVFDPLAVLMLVAANWSLKNRKEEEEPKDEEVFDTKGWKWDEVSDDFDPRPEEKVEWPEGDTRIETIGPNGNDGLHYDFVEEPKIGWDPKFKSKIDADYQEFIEHLEASKKPIEEPEWLKGDDVIASPAPPTIEQEVDKLQTTGVNVKEIEYDSVGRRITP